MAAAGNRSTSHPVDFRTNLREACEHKDLRSAALYLRQLLGDSTDEAEERSANDLLREIDVLLLTLDKGHPNDALVGQREDLLKRAADALPTTADARPRDAAVSSRPLLEMTNLERKFAGFDLRVASLEINAHELIGVVGMNSSGKSTLLRIAAGRLRSEGKGQVSYPGIEEAFPKSPPLAKVAFVPQEPEAWSGRLLEHLSLLLAFHGYTGEINRRRTAEVVEEFGLADLADRRWTELSGGKRARCALALAFAPEPRLVVMDEPMAALDPSARRWFLDHLYRLAHRRAGRAAVLISSHLVVELEAVATGMLVLVDGKLISDPPQAKRDLVLDVAVEYPWTIGSQLQTSLGLTEDQMRVQSRPDPKQVRITLPPTVSRREVLNALSEQGITPARFSDLTDSEARRL